jgi:putative transposase
MQTAPASEIAKVSSCTKSNICKRAKKEHWPFETGPNRTKLFIISKLPADIALLYNKGQAVAKIEPPSQAVKTDISADQVSLAAAKADLLSLYIRKIETAGHGKKSTVRDQFMAAYNSGIAWPDLFGKIGEVSWKTIEGWKKRAQKAGGDTFALADHRGYVRRGSTCLTPEIKQVLLKTALHPNRPKIAEAIRTARAIMAATGIQNGHSDDTYRRFLADWKSQNYHIWVFSRQGAKAWNDRCAVNIHRDYSLIEVGDIIVADGHTLNFETINPWTGKPKRMTLILWYDMKSSMPLGWDIMPTENTEVIASSLRRAIMRLGKYPKVAYLDNGRAFSGRFFNGADLEQGGFSGLFERLNIKTIFAWPYHGQSKTVERFFGTFAELERLAPTYSGTSIVNKPPRMNRGERLHRKVHEGFDFGLTLEQTHTAIAHWFDVYAARPQRGHLNGQSPADVFYPAQGPGIDMAELNFLMLAQDIRTISADGIRFHCQTYYAPALYGRRHPVRIRYDLQNRDSILVFEPDGRFLAEASVHELHHPAASLLGTAADVDRLSAAIAVKKSQEKEAAVLCRDLLRDEILPAHNQMMNRITGASAAGGSTRMINPPKEETPEKTDAQILADVHELEQMNPPAAAADVFNGLDDLPTADRYERLIAIEASGILMPREHQAFITYFEQTPAYTRDREYYDDLRARAVVEYQTPTKEQMI